MTQIKKKYGVQYHKPVGQPSRGHLGFPGHSDPGHKQVNEKRIPRGWAPIAKNIWTENRVLKHGIEIQKQATNKQLAPTYCHLTQGYVNKQWGEYQ